MARSGIPTWEDWTEDIGAVLDAIGWQQAAILAEGESGPIALLFAATRPDRVSALVLSNTTARCLAAPDYPAGLDPEFADRSIRMIGRLWGTTELARLINPSLANNEASLVPSPVVRGRRRRRGPLRRSCATSWVSMFEVRCHLIQVPTLVVHNDDNQVVPLEHGRYLAEHISRAKMVTLTGSDTFGSTNTDQYLNAIGKFLTGHKPAPEPNRVLATVLFTDMVQSTETAASMGDSRWRHLLMPTTTSFAKSLTDSVVGKSTRPETGSSWPSTAQPRRPMWRSDHRDPEGSGHRVRAGLHTGECERRDDDLAGLAVHIAARVATLGEPGQLLVTSTVKDLVLGSGIEFSDAGRHDLKGVPGSWQLYRALS